jgi:hypothetical protein
VTSATRTSIKMADGLGLDAWWDEPAYAASEDIFTKRGAFTVIVLQSSSMQSSPMVALARPTLS